MSCLTLPDGGFVRSPARVSPCRLFRGLDRGRPAVISSLERLLETGEQGQQEPYCDPRGLEEERPYVRACCLASAKCATQPFEPVPSESFFEGQFLRHWEGRHAGAPLPPKGRRWRVYDEPSR
jgi:hypothetical protein